MLLSAVALTRPAFIEVIRQPSSRHLKPKPADRSKEERRRAAKQGREEESSEARERGGEVAEAERENGGRPGRA
eukprot:g59320.t1